MAPASSGLSKKMGKFPDIAQWLEKAVDNQFMATEYHVDREHQNWTSEPELWLYSPGMDPHSMIQNRSQSGARRRKSIESIRSSYSRTNSASGKLQGGTPGSGGLIPLASGGFGKMTTSRSSRKLRVQKVQSSSKSDSYHKKYVWDMVFHERAVVAIQEECRQIRKIKAKNGERNTSSRGRHPHSSILSSGDDCSGASCFHKHGHNHAHPPNGPAPPPGMPMSPAAMYGMYGPPHMLEQNLQSVSRNHSKHSKHSKKGVPGLTAIHNHKDELEKRKFSQTGSSIFAQFDMRYREQMARGRHPATQQSQSAEKMQDGEASRNNSATKTVKPEKGGPLPSNSSIIPNTSGGTTNGPVYPTMPYMDPFMMQYMMQGMGMGFNPAMWSHPGANPYTQQFLGQKPNLFQNQHPFMNPAQQSMFGLSTIPSAAPSQTTSTFMNPGSPLTSGASGNVANNIIGATLQRMENSKKMAAQAKAMETSKRRGKGPTVVHGGGMGGPPSGAHAGSPSTLPKTTSHGNLAGLASQPNAPGSHADRNTINTVSNSSQMGCNTSHRTSHNNNSNPAHSSTPTTSTNLNTAHTVASFGNTTNTNTTDGPSHLHHFHAQHQSFGPMHHGHPHDPHHHGQLPHSGMHHGHYGPTPHSHHHSTTEFSGIESSLTSGLGHSTSKSKPVKTSVSDYLDQLKRCVDTLKQSGWYWGHISGEQAMRTVAMKGVGAYLIRDSSHQKYLFTVTVCTSNGATNVRIVYKQGLFGLDCEDQMTSKVRFPCVVKMVAYYVNNSRKYKRLKDKKAREKARAEGRTEGSSSKGYGNGSKKSSSKYSSSGKHSSSKHSTSQDAATTTNTHSNSDASSDKNSVALLLLKPCRKEPASLKHLARISFNRKLARKQTKEAGLTLDNMVHDEELKQYCRAYPYNI